MKRLVVAMIGLALGIFTGLQFFGDDEHEVALEDVPAHVLEAALEAVSGVEITEAETEDDGGFHYDLTGHVDGREVEIEISEDGEVLEVEWEDEDESEDDDDEAEDDDGR